MNWTIVTGVFDLASLPDAVDVLLERDIAHFLRHSTATLTLDQPMVIFCEPKTLDAIKERRPAHLHAKTKFIAMEFSDFPLYKYKSQIIENRKRHPEIHHNRCNPSYYLLCMARYAMLKQVIAEKTKQYPEKNKQVIAERSKQDSEETKKKRMTDLNNTMKRTSK